LPRHLKSPFAPAIVTAIMYLLFIVISLAMHRSDFSSFIVAGDTYADRRLVPQGLSVRSHETGYDGEFVYRLALNPFTAARTEFGITLDQPAYRQQRIIYPLLVWILSFGKADLVPVVLILVNYLALCAMACVGGLFAQAFHRHALWGIVFPFYPGFLLTLRRDLTEIVAGCFLLAALWFLRSGRSLQAVLLLTLALLARETTLIAVISVVAVMWWCGRRGGNDGFRQVCLFSVPILVWGLWQLVLAHLWRGIPFHLEPRALGIPFVGFVRFVGGAITGAKPVQLLWLVESCYMVLFAATVISVLRSNQGMVVEGVAWLLYLTLAVMLGKNVWIEDWSFLRVLSEFYLFGALLLLASRSSSVIPAFAGSLTLWVVLFLAKGLE
jgi:hypothetical protein